MLDSLTLPIIILAELVFVLALACGILTFVLLRERKQQQRLLKAYHRMRATLRSERSESRQETETETPGTEVDPVTEYLKAARDEARQRYRTITQSTLPRLSPEQPFNAKVAALRFLYCEAEERAKRKAQASGNAWILLERQLYDIVRWVVDQEDSKPSRQRNNQIKLLQQRVEKLKGYEKLCRDLQRKLELSRSKREELELLREENRLTIGKLEKINNALSLARELPEEHSEESLRLQLEQILQDKPSSARGLETERRLTNIQSFGEDHQRLSRDLTSTLRQYSAQHPGARSAELEHTIQRLEAELYRSERHIAELKQQSSSAPPNAPRKPTTDHGSAMEQIEDTLKVIHSNMADSSSRLSQGSNGGQPRSPHSLAEVQQLRSNNVRQRNLIVDLEHELGHLRQAIPETENSDERARQTSEVDGLERLVKECEHCILALESEVDMLYNQLKEREALRAQEQEPAPEEQMSETLTQLHKELDSLNDRLEAGHNDHLITQFALESVRAQTLEELARALFTTLKRAELIAGFYFNSPLGQAEYFPQKHFTPNERGKVRRTSMNNDVAYLNEGILFAGKHVHLMLKEPPNDEKELLGIERLMHSLMNLCAERIDALELKQANTRQRKALSEWSVTAHNTLVNMEISHAYQAEETLRLIAQLVEQIHHSYSQAPVSEALKVVVENAMSECQHRVRHLFTSDQSLEEGCTQLLEQLEHLPIKAP